ncbi:O-methyltransferase [Polyangium sorediatum]|uniref:Uncharacterized protein n=1 Tax=Polyangium sorediatum TaxID=889274 RepID=A0ABT6NTI4_9BACT|nr:O-methyltransferase [Polyangium sorediatum]MDI1431652.1 hypothetical protein [Polyangium sorediatum]
MSGGQVAYHLRPNKAIERHVFIELLTRFHGFCPIHEYTYIGFGGPFLEDFRMVESHFGVARMISLEGDAAVIDRQMFNRPFTSIECRRQLSGDFIATYPREIDGNAIVWLDYAEANARSAQIGEFKSLLTKVREYDVVKITMNASPATFPVPGTPQAGELNQLRFEAAERQLGDLWHPTVSAEDMTRKKFPGVILGCLLRAAKQAFPPGLNLQYVPTTSFVYADSEHQMLTLTGVIAPRAEVARLRTALRLKSWELAYREGGAPIVITTPVLSTRERVFLEQLLPKYRRTLARRGKFLVAGTSRESSELIESFARFHRYYPHFGRILP